MASVETNGCDIEAQVRRDDGSLASVVAAIDTKARADFISRRCAAANDLHVDTARRRRVVGATSDMRAVSDGMVTFDLITPSGTVRLEAIVLDGLGAEVVIGAATMQRVGTAIVASPTWWSITWGGKPLPISSGGDVDDGETIMSCGVETKPTTFEFKSRADELLSNINFGDVGKVLGREVTQKFRDGCRQQCQRLQDENLIIGSKSPGHLFPDALRGARSQAGRQDREYLARVAPQVAG
jgi:hypothetical protein